jgi:hypothetical protein
VLAESLPFASYGENCRACANIPISDIAWIRDRTEQQTGIEFPTFLEDNFNYTTEVVPIPLLLLVYAYSLYIVCL